MQSPADAWVKLAEWAAGPIAVPDAARSEVALCVTDTAACILAGWDEPAAVSARATAEDTPGDRAFRLAAAAHALDWDDYEAPGFSHPSAVMVPVILALGRGADPDPDAVVRAYAAGIEVIMGLGRVMNPECYARGFHTTGLLGALGAAATAGRLTGLDGTGMLAALSLAAGAASGLKAQFGTPAKALNAAFAARTGITAARLAASGATGNPAAICGETGLAGLFGGPDSAARAPALPGRTLGILDPGVVRKPWPCCGYLQRILREIHALALDPGGIETIAIAIPPRNRAVVPFDRPATPDEARFSPTYSVAAMIANGGRLGPADFTGEAIRRPDVHLLMERITVTATAGPQGPGDLSPEDPDTLRVTLRHGAAIERVCNRLPGLPDDPETAHLMTDKLAAAARPGEAGALAAAAGALDMSALLDLVEAR